MKTQIYNSSTKENTIRDSTDEEIADMKKSAETQELKKLREVRFQRNLKLAETDYLANSDMTMSDAVKTWRQSLRDLPQNNTTESQYDTLLATDENGNLTNSIWTKPS